MRLGLRQGLGFTGKGEIAQAAFDGSRYYRTTSGVYLKDFGHGDSDDSAKLYSGQMLDFDGVDDYVDCGNIVAQLDNVISLCATFNTYSSGRMSLISKGYYNYEMSIDDEPDNSRCRILCFIGNGSSLYTALNIYTNAILGDGDTHRIIAIINRSAGEASIYVDGVFVGSDVVIGYSPASSSEEALIGGRSGGAQIFDGQISNVQIWNAAFTADDVAFDYANLHHMKPAYENPDSSLTSANLKGWWPLIEGSGDVAYDWSGNGNHGTLTNFPTDDTQWNNADALDSPLVPQTALLEWGMGSNVLPYSDKFETAWAVQNGGISTSGTRLDGRDAVLFSEDASTGQHRIRILSGTGLLIGDVTVRVKVKKAGTKDACSLDIYNTTDSHVARATLTFSTGVLSNTIGTVSVTQLSDNWFLIEVSGAATVDDSYIMVGEMDSTSGIDGPSFYIDGVQAINGSGEIGSSAITHAQPATNALVPIRSWETAGQFLRNYGELNWNGRSYADAGNGADVNPSTALIVEMVQSPDKWRASTEFPFYKNTIRQYWYSTTQTRFRISQASGNTYGTIFDLSELSHVVLVFDRTTLSSYVNGTLIGAASSPYPTENISSSSLSFTLGCDSYGGNNVISQLPLLKMIIDAEAQAIIDGDLDAWVAKQYAKAQAKYGL